MLDGRARGCEVEADQVVVPVELEAAQLAVALVVLAKKASSPSRPRRSALRTKRIRACGSRRRSARRNAFSSGVSVEPSTASCAQSPRYSSRIHVSTRLAVAPTGSA